MRQICRCTWPLGVLSLHLLMGPHCCNPCALTPLQHFHQEQKPGSGTLGDSGVHPQHCCALVGHLMVDMWLKAGPETSYTLTALLLHRSRHSVLYGALKQGPKLCLC